MRNKRRFIAVGLLAVLVTAWVAWAVALLPNERSYAEWLYTGLRGRLHGQPAVTWHEGRDIVVHSAKAHPRGMSELVPPIFDFAVDIDATVDGVRMRHLRGETFNKLGGWTTPAVE